MSANSPRNETKQQREFDSAVTVTWNFVHTCIPECYMAPNYAEFTQHKIIFPWAYSYNYTILNAHIH